MVAFALTLALLSQADPSTATAAGAEVSRVHFRGAAEASAELFPAGVPEGSEDFFLIVTPMIAVDAGASLDFELGANLRLRLIGDHANDIGGILRGADWREPSDYGQILRRLRIGDDDGPIQLRAGPLRLYTLGRGLLLSRYTNMTNPDYHPAGATLTAAVGPTRTTLFASDILGARIFAGELNVDLGRMVSTNAANFDRYHAVLSVAQDFGRAGDVSPPVTLLDLEGDAALYRGEGTQVFAYAALGARPVSSGPSFGALLGVSADVFQLSGKLELRREGGAFRFGMFGAAYELSRFSSEGFRGPAEAVEQLPVGFSGYGEVSLAWVPGNDSATAPQVVVSAGSEVFAWGRSDLDVSVAVRPPDSKGSGLLRLTFVDLGQSPRYSATGELRYRIWPSVYALASAGTVFFPQPDGSLVRGTYAGIGLGADFER